ncbi:hypothetical protein F5884DRAFT_751732 [Xylogone sp. PMI_703]|nr:hypothetical protein F5884DRAFT_751732 [Xylogone sp. PMI_703]
MVLVTRLMEEENEETESMALPLYKTWIQQNGADSIVATTFSFIDHRIVSLNNKVITAQSLEAILNSQQQDSQRQSDCVGYLNFIKDIRNENYLRFYVGQTVNARRHISERLSSILHGSSESLHYFICSRGNGHRTATFLKLWEIPASSENSTSSAWYQAVSNILEMAFCRAFQSLPAKSLEICFGQIPGQNSFFNS